MNGFNNPFIAPYGMNQPFMPQMPAAPQQVTRVNGENGARAYQIGPNSSAMLLDESGTLVWLITTDGAGYKTATPYDITPHQAAPAPDYGSLEKRIKRLEDMINDSADFTAIKRRPQNTAADPADDRDAQIFRKPAGHADADDAEQPKREAGNGDRTTVWRGR